jgi:hypothetical protein
VCAAYANIGQKEAAFPLAERLMEIDLLNEWAHWLPGFIKFWDGQFDEALNIFETMMESFQDSFFGLGFYALSLAYTQDISDACSLLIELGNKAPGVPFSEIYFKYKAALEEDTEKVLSWESRELEAWAWRDFQVSYYVSASLSRIGAKEVALDWLEHSVDIGMSNYPFVAKYDPFLENIRGEPRFKKLMERVKHE